MKLRQGIAFVERHHTRETPLSGDSILAGLVNLREKTEHRRLSRFVPEFDVVLRGVIQAAFGSGDVSLIETAFAELAIGDGEPFFIADRPMIIEGLFERRNSLIPLAVTSLLQREVGIKYPQSSVVL